MTKEKAIDAKLIGFTTVAALMGFGFAMAMGVSAYGPGMMRGTGPGGEDREKMQTAVEEGDYETFVSLVHAVHSENAPKITETQFNEIVARHKEAESKHVAFETALASGYDAWLAYVQTQPKITDYVHADNFTRYVAMHEAMERGDRDTAKAIQEELGLPKGHGMGHGMMMGHGEGGKQRMGRDMHRTAPPSDKKYTQH